MGKEVHEISRFFVAPPRVFAPAPPSARASRTSLPRNFFTLVDFQVKMLSTLSPAASDSQEDAGTRNL